jgi:hypothetical protein
MKRLKVKNIQLVVRYGADGHYHSESHQVNKGVSDKSREKYLKRRR